MVMMMNLRKIKDEPTIYFSLFFFLFYFQHHVTSFIPPDKFALDCGFSGEPYASPYNRRWAPDDGSKLVSLGQNSQTSILAGAVKSSSSSQKDRYYDTARVSSSEFTYSFEVTDGQKFVRLFFYPATYANFDRSNALFSVKAGSFTLLKDFNASLTADNDDDREDTVVREYCINVEPGHRLNITFTPSTTAHPNAYAFINGIEVVSMPTNLYYSQSNRIHQVDNNTALEMAYRINVGGDEIPADQDTGMFRSWGNENTIYGYSVMQKLQPKEAAFGSNLVYLQEDEDVAPKDVYLTAQTSKNEMTWEFKVDSMFAYMIRLHFCELDPKVQQGDRVLQILIADTLAERELDVLGWTGGSLVAGYKDYVWRNQGSSKKRNLSIKLQKLPNRKYEDVILNGIEIFKVSDSSDNLGAPNPVAPSSPIKSSKNSKKNSKTPMVVVCVGAVLVVIILSVIGFLIYRRRTRAAVNSTDKKSSDSGSYFSIAEIRAATNDFDDASIIGVGGFGYVYKGQINKGKSTTPVAIKRLKPDSQQGIDEFQTEIKMLSQIRHPHLVSLIGYCNDDKEMIIVYEFMARGTLSNHLYNSDNQPLSWKRRLEICIGAAKALAYLHANTDENKQSVIHRDVKSTNILLNEDWVAKVSDFGLSRIGPTGLSRTHITTDVKGSIGYIDPEYYLSQQLTPKSDAYSFGVVLLEVLCGRPPILRSVETQQGCLVDWVKKCYEKGEIGKVVDPLLKGMITPQCLKKFVQIALGCLRDNGKHRPSMRDVLKGLETVLKMQGSMEDKIPMDGKSIGDDTTTLNRFKSDEESNVLFSTSEGSTTESFKFSSKVTIKSCEEIALVPAGVFSELANPTAR